ncbi:DUF2400 family protein, partial [Candidatus Sumerlaeota bacterium]|nr:DUF2400 family protein [Candidatus Sumerlaeota bacterium]
NLNLNPNLNPNPNLPSPLSLRAGNFMSALLRLDLADYFPNGVPREGPARPSFLYLLPSAAGTSACKRLHMFLRWAVRPDDGIDLGIWRAESPENLEYPVDTHILRIAQYLGATRRKTADARARREITTFFKLIAPDDPVRYDFSLCRLGILKHCPRRSDLTLCDRCELKPVCLNHRRLAKLART